MKMTIPRSRSIDPASIKAEPPATIQQVRALAWVGMPRKVAKTGSCRDSFTSS